MTADRRTAGRARTTKRQAHPLTAGSSFASSEAVRRKMQAQKARDTLPEMRIRRAVHSLGLRYRIDRPPLEGLRRRADLVFGPARVAVYVDGCFWHACPEHGTWPKKNEKWWRDKLESNVKRDRQTDQRLWEAGWVVIRIWEHGEPENAVLRIADAVRMRRTVGGVPT